MNNNTAGRFAHLDALRGVACLLVVIHHVWQQTNAKWMAASPLNVLICGYGCVCLFFMLSGFVLSFKFIGETNQVNNIIKAILKRPLRLGGIVVIASFIFIFDRYHFDCLPAIKSLFYEPFSYAKPFDCPLWTIEVELYGSFFVFALLLLINRNDYIKRLWILLAFIVLFHATYYSLFAVGMIMADCVKNKNALLQTHSSHLWILLPMAIWLFSQDRSGNVFDDHVSGIPAIIGALIIFSIALSNKVFQAILKHKILLFLGRISFALYAIHWLFVVTWFPAMLAFYKAQHFGAWSASAANMSGVALSLIAARLLTRWIDEPCIRWSGRIADAIVNPGAAKARKEDVKCGKPREEVKCADGA